MVLDIDTPGVIVLTQCIMITVGQFNPPDRSELLIYREMGLTM
jgi:hypothetical protein